MMFSNRIFDIEYEMDLERSAGLVQGILCNKSDREFGTVLLSFHFYDRENIRIGQEQIFVTEVEPKEKVRFSGVITLYTKEIDSVKLVKIELVPHSDYADVVMDDDETDPGKD